MAIFERSGALQLRAKIRPKKHRTIHVYRHEATSRFFEKGLNIMEAAAITSHKALRSLGRRTHL